MVHDEDTSIQILQVLERFAKAAEGIEGKLTPKVEKHPLDELSREEQAIILLVRGTIKTKKQAAEIFGVTRQAIQKWSIFCKTFNSLKAHERIGSVRLGTRSSNGTVDGITGNGL
ncbi:hypothetical protein [Thalassoglobus polymorphus]|uniref:Uncharacterized protein n=1 Tax=Thalassoglobus polymorphus TaxID=2527994 RepID=A0A517QH57_9PLAN|nr:hypothetical protein [Thalassoglobus polymorphus]QDT30945.1 hypothetical protein Mal48_01740 [Thalassoglobus polymorphus]QDT30989.1 hypothetical protein Mal48_02180 [Thalassoglobus polymorphus]